ncbi:MAG: trypsin-like peptidase domain-containing protein [Eubacteriales bacterium]|nr:trypsin-like peptidase domain-containing protein [Eubacteriales bacterium]
MEDFNDKSGFDTPDKGENAMAENDNNTEGSAGNTENGTYNDASGGENSGNNNGEYGGENRPFFSYSYTPRKPPKKRKSASVTSVILCVVISVVMSLTFSLIGISVGARIASNKGGLNESQVNELVTKAISTAPKEVKIESNTVTLDKENAGTVAEVAAECITSVVSINVNYFNSDGTLAGSGAGSGVFISTDGYVVTCNHVVSGGRTQISVTTYDGVTYAADMIGGDSWSDIAVLKVKDAVTGQPITVSSYKPLTTSPEGGLEYMCIGEQIVVIGNPLGTLPQSVSSGVISGLDRNVTVEGVTLNLVQIDAAINPGNSGGALFDMWGNLIGIVNAKSVSTDVEGIGYSIPSHIALDVVKEIIEKGYVSGRPYIGIEFSTTMVSVRTGMLTSIQGYEIKSYAFGDELKNGDIINRIDGKEITDTTQIIEILGKKSVGDKIIFSVYRKNSTGTNYILIDNIEITVHSSDDYYALGG